MSPRTRLLVLGIDAASPELLDRWARDGTLPNLGALVERGVSGRTRGVEGFFIGSTWPSMYTGSNPAQHGLHYQLQLDPGTYDLVDVSRAAFVRREPFWRALSDAGQRVAVLDVPLTRPETDLRGVQVVEWGGHDAFYGFHTWPPSLAATIRSSAGVHPGGLTCDGIRRTAQDYDAFVSRLELGAARKVPWTRALLADGGWDLFMQVFTESHCVGHQCWHLHDATHPAHDAAIAATVGDPVKRVYQAIDRAMGEIVADAGDVPIVIFSAHGMSHWYGAQFLLRDILIKLGATAAPPAARVSASRGAQLARIARHALKRLPAPIKSLARGMLGTVQARMGVHGHDAPSIAVDFAESRCFPLNNGMAVGGIRLNLIGREPAGLLRPGAAARAFGDALAADLLEIIDERTNRPLIRAVRWTADMYAGESLDLLPDLLVEWNDEIATGSLALAGGAGARVRVHSPKLGTLEGENDYIRTGEHRPGGWLVAAGPGITPGQLSREPSVMDLAPTFAKMLGVELAGRVVGELAGASSVER